MSTESGPDSHPNLVAITNLPLKEWQRLTDEFFTRVGAVYLGGVEDGGTPVDGRPDQ